MSKKRGKAGEISSKQARNIAAMKAVMVRDAKERIGHSLCQVGTDLVNLKEELTAREFERICKQHALTKPMIKFLMTKGWR